MKFDWYEASVDDTPRAVIEAINSIRPDLVERPCKPHRLYAAALAFDLDGSQWLDISYGGHNGTPHVRATSNAADELAACLRGFWPRSHTVSRVDVAADFDAPGLFDTFHASARDIALPSRVATSRAGDWDGPNPSRTFYVGSPTSPYRVRIYEKGRQQQILNPLVADTFSPEWVRVEAQVRPKQRAGKLLAATASKEALWGGSRWGVALASVLLHLDAPRLKIGTNRAVPDRDRSYHWFLRNNRRMLEELAANHGWHDLGPLLRDDLARLRKQSP